MSSSSCSHWWHAPVYIAATAALIIAAISSPSSPIRTLITGDATGQEEPDLIQALHRSGYHLTAVALQISTSSSSTAVHLPPSFTLFALPDSALFNLSLPAADDLLRRHITPLPFPLSALAALPRGTLIPTLLPINHLILTSSLVNGAITVNGVLITDPNLFVSGPHIVHGVAAPFPDTGEHSYSKKMGVGPRWDRVVSVLKSKGYVSFSLGLSAVLDSLSPSPAQATVFAPRGKEFDYAAPPTDMLKRAVRRHVAVGRFVYGELVGMQVGEEMKSVEEDWKLMITDGERNTKVEVNGIEIVEPEVYVDDEVVVHGIARDFATVEML